MKFLQFLQVKAEVCILVAELLRVDACGVSQSEDVISFGNVELRS